ncbi:MAG TPA: transglycosylase SLT domain-containing protein [Dissulfurispiraceae bacterium]|nr:transglycosylase SLT domain-containing protein [Dissulfurispiraceae bacterium]
MNIVLLISILISVFAFYYGDAAADVYRSVSPDGSVIYTNTPFKSNDRVMYKEQKKLTQPETEKSSADKKPVQPSGKKSESTEPKDGVVKDSLKRDAVSTRKTAYTTIVEEKAKKHNVDPKLVKSVIRAESNWNSMAVSPKGAMGLMQLMPQTAHLMGVGNAFDPEENIEGGVKYLRYLLGRFNGNLTLALAAYNAGPKTVERKGGVPGIPETVNYVQKVMGDYTGVAPLAYIPLSSQTRIHKVALEDGTILYTNMMSRRTGSY